jgi:hypothetical protein
LNPCFCRINKIKEKCSRLESVISS